MSELKVNLDLGLRDYEVQVWTIQDSYLATLKWSSVVRKWVDDSGYVPPIDILTVIKNNKPYPKVGDVVRAGGIKYTYRTFNGIDNHPGLLQEAKMGLVDDGTETFTFSIPMYLYVTTENGMEKIENPIWYMTLKGELDTIIKNMHKIKVIINKTLGTELEKAANHEKVYEFLITKVTELHEEDNPICNVECEGLAFHEIGKLGFKIELSSEVLYDRLKKYYEGKIWYDNNHIGHLEEPRETIDYWLNDVGLEEYSYKNRIEDGIFKYKLSRSAAERIATKWYYKIDMNYNSYSTLPDGTARKADKIYEDEYTSSWDDNLIPLATQCVLEKCRLVDANESNVYNLTQTIAENFNVFCRYEYSHDMNYCITGRTIIFYNNFILDENTLVELTYPHTSLSVEREYDATDITTKMFVRPEEDDSTLTGQISIIDTDANPTKEDYIMNFDYFHKIGTISDELYNSIETYNKKMREYNSGDSEVLRQLNNTYPNPTALSRVVMNDIVYVYLNSGWQTASGAAVTSAELSDLNDKVPDPVIGNTCNINGEIYTYTPAGWVDSNNRNVEGIISLLEMLIAKEERKIDVKANLTTVENSVKLAEERKNDAEKHKTHNANSSITYLNPLQYMILEDEYKGKYINLSTNHREIDLSTVHMYRKYVLGKSTLAESFPELDTVTLPEATPLTIDWKTTSAKNARKIYKKIYDTVHPNDTIGLNDVRNLIDGWCATINDPTASITIHDERSETIEPGDKEDTFYTDISILEDLIGWVLCALGYADVLVVHTTKFKRYMITDIEYNGKGYSIGGPKKKANTDDEFYLTAKGWNKLRAARIAWRLSVSEALKKSDISITHSGDNYTVFGHPNSWAKANKTAATIGLGANNTIAWTYGNYTSTSLFNLWSTYLTGSYEYFYGFLGAAFDIESGANEIKHFSGKYDSNNSLILLVDIPNLGGRGKVYLTYEFNPDTYYQKIYDMWEKKLSQASTELRAYQKELDLLELTIDYLKYQIRTRLREKYDTIKEFERMMGPALRESYWQPEDYHNYGDYYGASLGVDGFNYTPDIDTIEENIHAKFIWDTELFSEEEKCYYEFGVNTKKRYYESIDLQAFYNGLSSAGKTALINNIDNLVFTFYNDEFDKTTTHFSQYPTSEKRLYYGYNGLWYYELTMLLGGGQGTYHGRVNVTRQDKNRVSYVMGASMLYGFIKNASDKVVPIIMITGLDEMPDDVIDFIHLTDSYTGSSPSVGSEIHPGAQPMLGYHDGQGNYTALGKVTASHWILGKDISATNIKTVYPRIKINSLLLKKSSVVLACVNRGTNNISNGNVIDDSNLLKVTDDYYIFNRRTNYYITVKPSVLFHDLGTSTRKINVVTDLAFTGAADNDILIPYMNGTKEIRYSIDSNNTVTILEPPIAAGTISYSKITTNRAVDSLKLRQEIQRYYGVNYPFNLTYAISNGGTYIYLDAIDVMKENSVPKVAYKVSPNLKNHPTTFLYDNIGQIVMINDYELKLENVFGYISEVQLDLDHPWEDEITVKDYKNKFEDLFSSITAEVEEMKKRGGMLNNLSMGNIPPILSSAIWGNYDWWGSGFDMVLSQFLNSHFDGRDVVISELNEIFREAELILDAGAEARGKLASANLDNANMLASLLGNISERLEPTTFSISWEDPNDPAKYNSLPEYKIGDMCITSTGSYYMATMNKGEGANAFKPVYDGSVSLIKGATVEWNAETGVIDLLGENEINIKSGNTLNIAANADVNIVGNKSVNIGGTIINICSGEVTMEDENGDYTILDTPLGGVNITAARYDLLNPEKNQQSGVYIKPDNIEMISADIKMITGLKADGTIENGNNVERGSAISISGKKGIWIGTNADAGISLYSGTFSNGTLSETILDTATDGGNVNLSTGTSLVMNSHEFFFGTVSNSNYSSVLDMDSTRIILSVGTADKETAGETSSGVLILKDYIGMAIGAEGSGTFTALIMDEDHGFTVGHGSGFRHDMETSDLIAMSSTAGSYVRINHEGFYIGSTADLYINTNNIKILSDDDYPTRIAIGNNLNGILAGSSAVNTDAVTEANWNSNTYSSVNLVVNENGLFARGVIYANALYIDRGNGNVMSFMGTNHGDDYFNIHSDNFIIKTNASTGEHVFFVGDNTDPDSATNYIGYVDGTLVIKGTVHANAFTTGAGAESISDIINTLALTKAGIASNIDNLYGNLFDLIGDSLMGTSGNNGYLGQQGFLTQTLQDNRYSTIVSVPGLISAFCASTDGSVTDGNGNTGASAHAGWYLTSTQMVIDSTGGLIITGADSSNHVGTLTVNGISYMNGDEYVNGHLHVTGGDISLDTDSESNPKLRLLGPYDSNNVCEVFLKAKYRSDTGCIELWAFGGTRPTSGGDMNKWYEAGSGQTHITIGRWYPNANTGHLPWADWHTRSHTHDAYGNVVD